jgi:hypothetical protein
MRVIAMLDACAEGHSRRETNHRLFISWRGRSFHNFPKGDHLAPAKREVGTPQVKQLVRQLDIPRDCASRQLPELAGYW